MADEIRVRAFGQLLKTLRESLKGGRGESVEWVLQRLGDRQIESSQPSLAQYEKGLRAKPDPLVLWGLAEVYRVPFDGLVGVLHQNRLDQALTLPEARTLLEQYRHGPSPQLAAEILQKTSAQLLQVAHDIDAAAATVAQPRRQTPAARRRAAKRNPNRGKVR